MSFDPSGNQFQLVSDSLSKPKKKFRELVSSETLQFRFKVPFRNKTQVAVPAT